MSQQGDEIVTPVTQALVLRHLVSHVVDVVGNGGGLFPGQRTRRVIADRRAS